MATQEYTQLDSPIRFPQSGVAWKDDNSGSVTVPARTLETGDTLSYEETGVVYIYDSVVYTWTGEFGGSTATTILVVDGGDFTDGSSVAIQNIDLDGGNFTTGVSSSTENTIVDGGTFT